MRNRALRVLSNLCEVSERSFHFTAPRFPYNVLRYTHSSFPRRPPHALAVYMLGPSLVAFAVFLSPPLHAPHRYIAHSATPSPRAAFGLSEREMRRLSAMKTSDEPLEEEVEGLCILGGMAGAVLGVPLLGSGMIGALLGVQFLGPLLAFSAGPSGDRLRMAGWHTQNLSRKALKRSEMAWNDLVRMSEESGLIARLERVRDRLLEWDQSTGMSRRFKELALQAWQIWCGVASAARRLSDRSGLTARAQTLWYATRIPKFVQETRENAVLRARLQALREREQFG